MHLPPLSAPAARGAVSPRDRRWSLGIRARLLLLMMALVVPFLIYLGASLTTSFDVERAHAQREVLDTAQLTAARLEDRLSSIRALLGALSQSLAPHGASPAGLQAQLRSLTPDLTGQVANLSVWSSDGQRIASLHAGEEGEAFGTAHRALVRDVLRHNGFAVAAPVGVTDAQAPLAIFGIPLMQDGQPRGVVIATLQLLSLGGLLDPQGSLPRGGVITVIDAQGTIISRSLEARHWIGRTMLTTPAQRAPLGLVPPGVAERVSFDGVLRFLGHAPVKTVSWTVFVGVPTETALAPLRQRLLRSLSFGVAMLLLGIGLAYWAAGRITGPLLRLDQDMALLGRGGLRHRSAARSLPEIERLTDTLNRTADALQERTQALEDAQALLRTVTDCLPALVSLVDRSERFLFANRAYQDWLGHDPAALLGLRLKDLWGDDVDRLIRPHLQAAWAGQRTVYERAMNTLQGQRWALATLVPRRTADGTVSELCVMILDVTERKLAREQLARSEERLSLALEGSGLSLFDWDIPANRVFQSAQAAVFRGDPPLAATSTPAELRAQVHPDDLGPLIAAQERAISSPEHTGFHAEFRLRTRAGGWVWLRSRGRVVERDAQGRAVRLAGTQADIGERKAVEHRLRQLAEHDHLTGLPNRALFQDRLAQALERARRHRQALAVMFLDIDHFKAVNDTLGHEVGDALLKGFAARLREGVRRSDTVARLAGDEFTVILEDLHDGAEALAIARTLLQSARQPLLIGGHTVRITTSVGIAIWREGEIDGPGLLHQADMALYEAKRRGRDGCHLIDAVPATAAAAPHGALASAGL